MKPVVFLDFDGVMNSKMWFETHHEELKDLPFLERASKELDPQLVARVKRIVDDADAEVVISSSWRILHSAEQLGDILTECGWFMPPIIGVTPRAIPGPYSTERGVEVNMWLTEKKFRGAHVILDDGTDFLPGQPLVQTEWEIGITEEDVDRALKILRR
jgi:hypothetical protein